MFGVGTAMRPYQLQLMVANGFWAEAAQPYDSESIRPALFLERYCHTYIDCVVSVSDRIKKLRKTDSSTQRFIPLAPLPNRICR
jgi:hypothetical protein